MQIDAELSSFVSGGVAVIMATCDERMRPQISRAWGPRIGEGGETLTACFEARGGSPTQANLERGGTVAVTFSQPSSYRTVQMKGRCTEIRELDEADHGAVDAHVEAFSIEVVTVGLTAASARRFVAPHLAAMTISIDEIYDQTPGPNAGQKL